jgi:PPOX class probable F420-dependent enzyme
MEFTSAQRAFLDRPQIAVLSTLGPDGAPHAAAMWYVSDDDRLLMLTGESSQKRRNMERDPRVAVVVDHRARPYYALTIRGRARLDPIAASVVREQFAVRYLSPDKRAEYLASRRDVPGVVFAINADRVLEYGTAPD